jgi:hypothetical protein
MALTREDFPNDMAFRQYQASEAAKNKVSADAAKKSKPKAPAGAGGGGGGAARPAADTAVSRVTPVEPVDVEEEMNLDEGMTEYERRMVAIAEDQARRMAEANEFRPREDAEDVIRRVLRTYGLEELTTPIWQRYTSQEVDINDEAAVIFSIREEDAYKKRFAANAKRLAAGMAELEPSTYLEMEDSYRKVLASNGMPQGFYDNPNDFQAFIEGDVSVTELQNRIQQGYRLVQDADPMVKSKMRELYNVSEGDLAAYFIDPERAKPLMMAADYQRQARAAQIAARAQEQGGIQLTGALAEDLARRGVTQDEASRGFSEISQLGELRQTFAGEDTLTGEQIIGAQFGIDTTAATELERRKRRRISEFTGGGSFARTAGESGGAARLAIGTAQ